VGAKTDYLIGLLILFGPWAAGWFAGARFGRTGWRLVGVIAVGLVLTALGLLAFFLTADPWATSDCYECSEYLGRALDYTLVEEWPIYNAGAWTFAALGTWVRADMKPQSAVAGGDPLSAAGSKALSIARFLAVAAFMTACWVVLAGLLFSSLEDWRVYVYAVVGGIGAAVIAEWSSVRYAVRAMVRSS
jgi:hypothetical protein